MYTGKYDKEEIMRLHMLNKKNEEIAAIIGCSTSTVKKTIRSHREDREEVLTEKDLFAYEWFKATAAVKKGMRLT